MPTANEQAVQSSMRRIQLASVACFVVALVVTVVFFGWWALKDRIVFGHEKFNQVAWITSTPEMAKTCHRGDMAYDLQQNVLFTGMSRQQATVLLGRPTWDDRLETGSQIEYDLGTCMHVIHGIRLFFDEHDQLTHSRIVQH